MTGNIEKLGRKAETLILALLAHGTIAEAAKTAGIGEKTAHRWLQNDEFQTAYREARRRVVEQSLATIQAVTSEAVETLRRNLTCGKPSVEVSAAQAIINHAVRAVELIDLEERLAAIEARFAEQQTATKGGK